MSSDSESELSPRQKSTSLDQFRSIWFELEPFYGGKSTLPAHQTSLFYTCPSSGGDVVHRRIDLLKADADELAALYDTCKPAAFGRNGETVLDDTYRKAKKMDLGGFATLFDPHAAGILERVSRALLTGKRGPGITDMELYKLNVYGEGDFFKPHKDTPRDKTMVGSLVVVLPTRHEGGQLVLRLGRKEWTLDFAATLAAATEPMVCFVAFFGDVEHEVLPITSGYRVTLTYNLYRKMPHPTTSYIPTPFHDKLKKAVVELVNDKSTLPEGGYLGCGLVHEYVYDEDYSVNALLDQLKGADQVLATVCEELGLERSLTLLYRDLCYGRVNFITQSRSTFRSVDCSSEGVRDFLKFALQGSSITQLEGVEIVGKPFDPNMFDRDPDRDESESESEDDDDFEFLRPFYKDPATKILEIRSMSSVETATPYVFYGNEATLDYVYGRASMLIVVDPVASRKELVL